MKEASKTMYKIGRIFSYVLLGIYALVIVLNIILLAVDATKDGSPIGDNISNIVTCSIFLVLTILCIVFATRSIKEIEEGSKEAKPHIVMIVFGALCGDIFYLLGGIFGLVANGQSEEQSK